MAPSSSKPDPRPRPRRVSAHTAEAEAAGPDIRLAAIEALAAGLSIWPPCEDGSKAPAGSWKRGQTTLPTVDRIRDWYGAKGPAKRTGLGTILGAVSGHAEALEFDASGAAFEVMVETAQAVGLGELVARLRAGYEERSPGGGVHWLYRCPEGVSGNTKLARRFTGEIDASGLPIMETLIETRGEGGYLVLAPSYGDVHPTGRPYVLLQGSLKTIPVITAEERAELFKLARTFDIPAEVQAPQPQPAPGPPARVPRRTEGGLSVIQDYNQRTSWDELLVGWVIDKEVGDTTYYRRPGDDKKTGVSATVRRSTGRLYVFSTNTSFIAEKPYDKFDVYAHIHHKGDVKAATAALGRAGYGPALVRPPQARQLPGPGPAPAPPAPPRALPGPAPGPASGRNGQGPGHNGNGNGNGDHNGQGHGNGPVDPPPAPELVATGPRPVLANYRVETTEGPRGGKMMTVEAYTMPEVMTDLEAITPGWPKVAGGELFVPSRNGGPRMLDSADQLLAWVDAQATVDWMGRHPRAISPRRFFEHLHHAREQFDAVDTLPHWPPMPRVYYLHDPIEPADNGLLDQFLGRLSPATELDRELVRALVLTYFWGGAPGTRPAFLLTGDEQAEQVDAGRGRGVGKSTLASLPAEILCKGSFNASRFGDIDKLKTRLLSREGLALRAARLDNIKTVRFSWDDFEELVTTSIIGGHRMYKGEGSRPNTLTWTITLNGASLSKDLAQRVIPIRLERPQFAPSWRDDLLAMLTTQRIPLLANIRYYLEREPAQLLGANRWASWERGVLSRVNLAEACRKMIVTRQGEVDDDEGVTGEAEAFLARKLAAYRLNPKTCHVKLPSSLLAEWVSEFTRKPVAINQGTKTVLGWHIPMLRRYKLEYDRGLIWRGQDVPEGVPECDLPPIGGF